MRSLEYLQPSASAIFTTPRHCALRERFVRRLSVALLGVTLSLPSAVAAQSDFFSVLGTAVKKFDGVGAMFGPSGLLWSDAFDEDTHGLQSWGFYVRSSELSASVGVEFISGLTAHETPADLRGGIRVLPAVTARLASWELDRGSCGTNAECPTYVYLSVQGGLVHLSGVRATRVTGDAVDVLAASGSGFTGGPVFGVEFPIGSGPTPIGGFVEILPRYLSFPSVDWKLDAKSVAPPNGWPVAASGWTGVARVGIAVAVGGPPKSSPAPPTIITTSPLPRGSVGVPYSHDLRATGGDGKYEWRLEGAGAPGLQVSQAGQITGTPSSAGSWSMLVSVTSAGTTVQRTVTITVAPGNVPSPVIAATSLPEGEVDKPYFVTLQATGGDGTYAWSLAGTSPSLPAGLTLSPGGELRGTPASTTDAVFSFVVTSAGRTSTKSLRLRVR